MATYNSFHWTTWNKGNFFYVLFSDTRLDRIKVAVGSLSLLQKKWCQITARSKATQEPGKNRALYPPTFLQPPRPNQPPTPLCPNPPFRHADFSISFLLLILSFNKTTASCLLTNGGGRKTSFEKIIWNTVKMQMIILLCFLLTIFFFTLSLQCAERMKNSGDFRWKTRPFRAKREISCWTNSTQKARTTSFQWKLLSLAAPLHK